MYNGQFIKGLIHVVIFAVLVSAAHVYDVFGIFIAAWIVYQSFEAYHTAKARRDGMPLPDPLGLNDAGSWFTPGGRPPYQGPPGAGVNPANPGQAGQGPAEAGQQIPYQQSPYQQARTRPLTRARTPPRLVGMQIREHLLYLQCHRSRRCIGAAKSQSERLCLSDSGCCSFLGSSICFRAA